MKVIARALGAAVIGIMFTLAFGALLVLHVAKADDEEREQRGQRR